MTDGRKDGNMTYSKEFEYFWRMYPHRNSKPIKKRPAWNMWQRLTDDEIHEIGTKAKYIKQFEGGKYARDAVTWLHPENQRGWEDITFKEKWVPVLPPELTENVLKKDVKTVDINTIRNKQRKGLGL